MAWQACEAKDRGEKALKKAVATARTNIKNGEKLDQAESAMRQLLADTANVDNERVWNTLFDAVLAQYDQVNEKIYLKQAADTAQLFDHTMRLFVIADEMDHHGMRVPYGDLQPIEQNLFNGGGYYAGRQQYDKAYSFFGKYLERDCSPEAAYWATFCGNRMGRTDIVKRYAEQALNDTLREEYVLQYLAEAFMQEGDTAQYLRTLEYGRARHPENRFMRINHDIFRSTMLLQQGRYDDCVAMSHELLQLDPTLAVAKRNIGLSYYNQTIPLANKKVKTKAERAEMNTLYEQARPFLEQYRHVAPAEQTTWAIPLYNIYLNLNMGDEFEEMERLLNNQKN